MTTKVAVGNGKFCYSGPNCRLHGVAQIAEAKKQLFEAEGRLAFILQPGGNFLPEQVEIARQEVSEAQDLYDATTEGQQYLRDIINRFDPTIQPGEPLWFARREFQRRLMLAETYADKNEEYAAITQKSPKARPWETAPDADGLVSIDFAPTHTYQIFEPEWEGLSWGDQFTGAKYDEGRSLIDTKKAIKAEIKDAVAKNYLPSNVQYSVTSSTARNSINIQVRGLNAYATQVDKEVTPEEYKRLTELERRLTKIMNSFNRTVIPEDNSLPRSAFRGWVDAEMPSERKDRLAASAQRKRATV